MIKDFVKCVCNDDCGYEYITNSFDNIQCPNCGSDNVETEMVKTVVLSEWSYDDLEASKDLKTKIENSLENLKCVVNSAIGIKDLIEDFCKENNLEIPTEVNLEFDRHFDFSEKGEDYLSNVVFKNSSQLSDELHEKLLDELTMNYSLWELQQNDCIIFK